MKHFIILVLTALLLSSCYEQTIDVKRNLTGTINYKLNISNDFKNFLNTLNGEHNSLDLKLEPIIDSEALAALVKDDERINLVDRRKVKKGESELSEITLAFRKMSELEAALPSTYFKNSVYKAKNTVNVSTTLTLDFLGPSDKILAAYKSFSEEEKKFIDSFAALISLKFTYQSYNEIIKAEGIKTELSADKRRVTFTYTLFDLLNSAKAPEILVTIRQ